MVEAELNNVLFRAGDRLKVQGRIHLDAKRFQVDLGSGSSELALHFNPRFHDGDDKKPVLVCNSKWDGIWNQEQRETHTFQPGSTFKVVVKHAGGQFELLTQLGCEAPHSYIHFILVDPEPVLEKLDLRREYTLYETSVCRRASCAHISTPRGISAT
ncbi:hypothetical protein KOW79_012125 [Hemibagrus wyckioides]|uniref:Galectin n=1 Tax=Hemibagrus wyckioides TaxID=337641 RepID=A0A9D3SLY3_9TELE|nr:hypothetical protein KOW79_012125 [Hemibagrus wyckioides]